MFDAEIQNKLFSEILAIALFTVDALYILGKLSPIRKNAPNC